MNYDEDINDLITHCKTGDDAAHAEFYSRYYPFISHSIAHQLRNLNVYHSKSDIEDLASEVILKISDNQYQRLSSLRNKKSINGWLYVVSRNHVISHVRGQARHDKALAQYARESQESYGSLTEFQLNNSEEEQLLHQALRALAPQDRLIVTLYYIDHKK